MHIAWEHQTSYGNSGPDSDILYISKSGDSWSAIEVISTESNGHSYNPSLDVNSSVDFYINASQGDKINGGFYPLNFIWENYGRPAIESDKFKVIIFDPEVKKMSGEWEKATKFLVDIRTPENDLPLNSEGELVGGFRKVIYKDRPAIEASFGYGYTDYDKKYKIKI